MNEYELLGTIMLIVFIPILSIILLIGCKKGWWNADYEGY